jgi:hypothetical protein
MLIYMPALVKVSENLLAKMEANPSAQGVAEAFLSVEEQLEDAFVAWCGVVGTFFEGDKTEVPLERSSSDSGPRARSGSIKRRVGSWGKKINSKRAAMSSLSLDLTQETRGTSRPPVRDLAILPTQRVMRYTLLFKGVYWCHNRCFQY